LCIRAELTAVPAFEFSLRDRFRCLSSFQHPYFVPARVVERLSDRARTLALVSDRFNGIRLAQLLPRIAQRGVRLDIDTTVFWLRQLLDALARFHESSRDIAHGALGLDRVILTSNGRLMVTEYALGAALERLAYPAERYWHELHVPVLWGAAPVRLDQRTDVAQVGILALSLILGRVLRDDEYPARIGDLLAAAWAAVPSGGFEPVPPPLRQWLARTLQLDPSRSFPSADEASRELERVCETIEFPGSPASVQAFLERYRSSDAAGSSAPVVGAATTAEPYVPPPRVASPLEDVVHSYADDGPTAPADGPASIGVSGAPPTSSPMETSRLSTSEAPAALKDTDNPGLDAFQAELDLSASGLGDFASELDGFQAEGDSGASNAERARHLEVAAFVERAAASVAASSPTAEPFTVLPPTPEFQENTALPPEDLPRPRPTTPVPLPARRGWKVLAGAFVGVVLVMGLTRWFDRAPVEPSSGTLAITTAPRGATAIIDGRPAGVTPVTLTVGPGYHTVELQYGRASKVVSVTVQAGSRLEQHVELLTEPQETVPSGWISVRTDLDLDVYEDNKLIGNTVAGRLALTAGTHVLTFSHDQLGFRTTRSVAVSEGKSTTTVVELPNGLIRVLVQPWADVWVDGKALGRSPVENLPVPIGTHDVVLRHPELGEQRHRMRVSVNELARLDVDLRAP
jgi:serine/threonine protein kinase